MPRSQVRNMLNLERKTILLRFSQNLKGFMSSVLTRRCTGFQVWHGSTCFLAGIVSCMPIIHPGVTQWWEGSEHRVWDPHENLYPLRRSKLTGNMVFLPWLPSIFHSLVVGISAPCWTFYAASLIPLSKLPLALLIFSLPHLPTREQRQCRGYLRISVFVEVHRQGSETSSRFPGPCWAEERDVIQFRMKKGMWMCWWQLLWSSG